MRARAYSPGLDGGSNVPLPWLLVGEKASAPRLEVISTFLHEYKVQCDYDRLGRDLLQSPRDGAMHTIRTEPGDTRKRGRRAVHLDRAYIGARKREARARERTRFFRRSAPSGITTCKERWASTPFGPVKFPDFIYADKKSRVQ